MNDFSQILKGMEAASSELAQITASFEKAMKPLTESLQQVFLKIDPATFRACLDNFGKNYRLIQEHRDIFPFLRDDVSLEEVFSTIVKTPKEKCDDELLRLYGVPELEGFTESPVAPLLPQLFNLLLRIFQLWSVLMTLGVTHLTFADFVSELVNAPTQAVQKTHENPSVPDCFNKNVKIARRRDEENKNRNK